MTCNVCRDKQPGRLTTPWDKANENSCHCASCGRFIEESFSLDAARIICSGTRLPSESVFAHSGGKAVLLTRGHREFYEHAINHLPAALKRIAELEEVLALVAAHDSILNESIPDAAPVWLEARIVRAARAALPENYDAK